MNEHESYVSLETAELLNKVGFGWNCRGLYIGTAFLDAYFNDVVNCTDYKKIQAPTLEVAQRWLREVKNIEICISWEIEFEEKELDWNERRYCYDIDTHVDNIPLLSIDDDYWAEGYHTFGNSYSTYEEALEAGIQKCLTILLEEKK